MCGDTTLVLYKLPRVGQLCSLKPQLLKLLKVQYVLCFIFA